MASTKNTTLAILFTFSAAMTACDEGNNAPDQAQAEQELELVENEEEIDAQEEENQLVSEVALTSEAREQLFAQFDARGVDRSDINSCGDAGLLASIIGAQGRHFTFCGDGAVMQLIPSGVEKGYEFASKDLIARIQEVAPESAEIPASLLSYDIDAQYGGVANPLVAGYAYEPVRNTELEPHNSCNDVRADCAVVEQWAENWRNNGSHWQSMSWCRNRDHSLTWSTRTFSKQLGISDDDMSIVTGMGGYSFVSACGGESVTFRGRVRCWDGKWRTKYKKTVNEYERAEINLDMGSVAKKCEGVSVQDLRFTVRNGRFVGGGAYGVNWLTF